jgi:hypothetical protein
MPISMSCSRARLRRASRSARSFAPRAASTAAVSVINGLARPLESGAMSVAVSNIMSGLQQAPCLILYVIASM